MTDEWNVKKTIRCARCGEEVEFTPVKAIAGRQEQGVKGIRIGMFNAIGANIFTNKKSVPSPLCDDCYAALEKWLKYSDTPDCEKEEELYEIDLNSQPDSLERIVDELEEWSEDNRINGEREVFDRAGKFADRIRKLAEKED